MRSVHKVQAIDQILTIDYNSSDLKPISSDKTDLDTLLTVDLSQKGINYQHQENRYIDFDAERMLPQYFSNEGPAMTTADLNGDGLDDISWEELKGSLLSYTLVHLLDILKPLNPSRLIKTQRMFRHYFSMPIVMEIRICMWLLGVAPFLKLVQI